MERIKNYATLTAFCAFMLLFLPFAWAVGLVCWVLAKLGLAQNLFVTEIE